MKIVLYSGTTEGRLLSHRLAELGLQITVCVATEYGREEQGTAPNITVQCGYQTVAEMCDTICGADLCIDATHPYAEKVTANIRAACRQCAVPYRRLLRPKSQTDAANVVVSDASDAAAYLAAQEGNILLTTGAKEIAAYKCIAPERLFVRVLPMHASLTACEQAGIPSRHIIAVQGPFSAAFNEILLREYDIRYLVTKDGGSVGGFEQKREAAQRTGAQLIVIARPEEQDGCSMDQIFEECKETFTCR